MHVYLLLSGLKTIVHCCSSTPELLKKALNINISSLHSVHPYIKMSKALFSFGIIADVQYADIDDGYDFSKTRRRYYRDALCKLKSAVGSWKTHEPQISFILQLGDIVDGHNKRFKQSEKALNSVIHALNQIDCPCYNLVGNHELYNYSRESLCKTPLFSSTSVTCMDEEEKEKVKFYHQFSPYQGYRVIVLDSFNFSTLGYPKDSHESQAAFRFLRKYNDNNDLNSASGLKGVDRRYSSLNGGIGKDQLHWLDVLLTSADQLQERVIICGECIYK